VPWYKFEKFFKGGSHHDYLFLNPQKGKKKVTHGQLQEEMESWGEKTGGGHNYGFTVYYKYVKSVPLKVLKEKLENTEKYHSKLANIFLDEERRVIKRINFLKEQIKKQKRS
jgi:hypothetical protein